MPVQSHRCKRSCHSGNYHEFPDYKDDDEDGEDGEDVSHLDEDVLGLEIPVSDRGLQALALARSKLTWDMLELR